MIISHVLPLPLPSSSSQFQMRVTAVTLTAIATLGSCHSIHQTAKPKAYLDKSADSEKNLTSDSPKSGDMCPHASPEDSASRACASTRCQNNSRIPCAGNSAVMRQNYFASSHVSLRDMSSCHVSVLHHPPTLAHINSGLLTVGH